MRAVLTLVATCIAGGATLSKAHPVTAGAAGESRRSPGPSPIACQSRLSRHRGWGATSLPPPTVLGPFGRLGRRLDDWAAIRAEGDSVVAALADLLAEGADATGCAGMDLAEAHRCHIDRWFYPCTHDMAGHIAAMYTADPRFTAYFEKRGGGARLRAAGPWGISLGRSVKAPFVRLRRQCRPIAACLRKTCVRRRKSTGLPRVRLVAAASRRCPASARFRTPRRWRSSRR